MEEAQAEEEDGGEVDEEGKPKKRSSKRKSLIQKQMSALKEAPKKVVADGQFVTTGKLLLCDLAGSERLKKSMADGQRAKEAIEINKSLTALGDVIEALTTNTGGTNSYDPNAKGRVSGKAQNTKNIPYRNHKLTQLFQDSIGGTSKTLMMLNVSPASFNLDETIMTLRYGQRSKFVKNKHAKNKPV